MKVLITGGAGFVGSSLAIRYRETYPDAKIIVFDNLKRRGSEINLTTFKKLNITFVHGDIRSPGDLEELRLTHGPFDYFVEASAEPSVLAGLNGTADYLLQTNLVGTLNCLEMAKKSVGAMVFLSTSRVYSIEPLKTINLVEAKTRLEIDVTAANQVPGVSALGISEKFPLHLPRSLYGATKLASELIIQEYVDSLNMKAVINRCGVIAGPGQFGKVDQGVFTLWVANHYFKKKLKYTGFGGQGKQVRDLLHPHDLFRLIQKQFDQIDQCSGKVYNVGGGRPVSTSLLELTKLCESLTGNSLGIESDLTTSSVDIPLYLSDSSQASKAFDWTPEKDITAIVTEIYQWINRERELLTPIFN